MSTPFTVMIAAIASITIILSLQRLVQTKQKLVARTLGKGKSLLTGYLYSPAIIGSIGCLQVARLDLRHECNVGFLSKYNWCNNSRKRNSFLALLSGCNSDDDSSISIRYFTCSKG